jgi:hypothetical protein
VRLLSQAIAEGDGISVLVEVSDVAGVRNAEEQGADGLVVRQTAVADLGDVSELPLLLFATARAAAAAGADAVVLAADGEEEQLEERYAGVIESGLECVLRVCDEEDVERVLEALDPEIFLLSADRAEDDQPLLERVLELLPEIPAGKLAIADLPGAGPGDVVELERAGIDAVIVRTADVRSLVGDEPPDV